MTSNIASLPLTANEISTNYFKLTIINKYKISCILNAII